ncbi:MAG: leucine-rich repeat domain-containing protein [Bacteroidaceae bacterium]|nr:leucine-rich repeat domain-containing protein [Bacteroidaceae bacterium]
MKNLVIPNSVTSIGNYAFSGYSGLTSVTIPNSVTSIGDSAFSGCSGLTSITIPESVTSIGNWVFYGCTGLTSISIPESVTSIGNWVFYGCTGLTSISIGNSVTSIGICAFEGCSGLTSITIPYSVTSIGSGAFSGCSSLTSITIPNSVTSIGKYAIPTTTMIFTSVEKSLLALWNAGYNNIKEINTGKDLNIPTLSLVKTTASSLILNVTNDYPKYYNCTVKGSGTLIIKEDGNMFLTGLIPNTSYNNLSLALALGDVSYTTSPISARTETLTLTTQQPKVISAGNVIVAAESNLDDEETNVGFEWRRYDWPDDFASNSGVAYLYDGTMEGYIRNLYTGAFWKYRPYYESNAGNRYYGDWVGIDPTNTNYFEPTVRTYATITVTGNRAEVRGYAMRGTDRVTSQGFMYWKNTSSYSLRKKAPSIPSDAVTVEASGNVMTAVFEDLDYETEYCYVAFVKTEENETFFGEVQTFSTNVDPDAIESLTPTLSEGEGEWYDLSGRKIVNGQSSNSKLPRGINIIRYSDGTTRKVLVK